MSVTLSLALVVRAILRCCRKTIDMSAHHRVCATLCMLYLEGGAFKNTTWVKLGFRSQKAYKNKRVLENIATLFIACVNRLTAHRIQAERWQNRTSSPSTLYHINKARSAGPFLLCFPRKGKRSLYIGSHTRVGCLEVLSLSVCMYV